jgi:hypothetical protein
MDAPKSHADIQRAYRWKLKQENPDLLRLREREKWRRQCLKKRTQHNNNNTEQTESQTMTVMHQDICDYDNRDISRDAEQNNDYELSVKYPICHLLRWLEHVETDDDDKYAFLKYLYDVKGTAYSKGSPYECNRDEAKDESNKNHVPFHHSNERKRIPIESSSESDVSDMLLPKDLHHEKTERAVTRVQQKSAKKMKHKAISKKTPKRRKVDITWEPLYFDDDESQENYE